MKLPSPIAGRRHGFVVERDVKQSPARLYWAWTQGFDDWFAAPGSVAMRAEIDAPFFIETHMPDENGEPQRHPHHGRFLVADRLVEITRLTGARGAEAAKTIVTVEFEPKGRGLTHAPRTQRLRQRSRCAPTPGRMADRAGGAGKAAREDRS